MKNNIKKFKILIFNSLFFILVFFLLEFIAFTSSIFYTYEFCGKSSSIKDYIKNYYYNYFQNEFINYDDYYKKIKFREVSGENYKRKRPIIIFGCSFAYGDKLEQEETLSHLLSKELKQKIYNRAYPSWGPQNMLYQLKDKNFYKVIQEKPSAIIYVTFIGQSRRLFHETFLSNPQIFYKKTTEGMKKSYFSAGGFGYGYLAKKIRFIYTNKFKTNNDRKVSIINHFLDARKEIQHKWGNIPFNIVIYSYDDVEKEAFLDLKYIYNFNVIFLDKILTEDINTIGYQISQYDPHPNAKAWELIVPKLSKEIKIE